MTFLKWTLPLAAVAMFMIGFAGCDSSQVTEPDGAPMPSETDAETDHEGMDHSGHEMHDHSAHAGDHKPDEMPAAKSDMDKMMESLASFSEEDRASATKQHFCPVSGEMLGAMGAPEKMEVEGQTVWICCDGCKDKLLAEPDKYLAKINK